MKEFTLQKIKYDIYLITEPYFYEHANLFLIKGAEYDLLIDCGLGLFDLKSFLREKGFNPKVFLTHSHFDHVGGIKYFAPSEILAIPAIQRNLNDCSLWGLAYLKPEYFDASSFDVSPEEICNFYSVSAPKGLQNIDSRHIIAGTYRFEIIPTPGHTDDSVVLHDRRNKLLISGDTLYDGEIYAGFSNSNRQDFLNSLQKIRTLDFDLILTGHNQILDRGQALAVIERWTNQLKHIK